MTQIAVAVIGQILGDDLRRFSRRRCSDVHERRNKTVSNCQHLVSRGLDTCLTASEQADKFSIFVVESVWKRRLRSIR